MKSYLKSKLTQSSAWIGFFIIISSFILPRTFIMFGGLLLILNDDEKLKKLFSSLSPKVAEKLDELG